MDRLLSCPKLLLWLSVYLQFGCRNVQSTGNVCDSPEIVLTTGYIWDSIDYEGIFYRQQVFDVCTEIILNFQNEVHAGAVVLGSESSPTTIDIANVTSSADKYTFIENIDETLQDASAAVTIPVEQIMDVFEETGQEGRTQTVVHVSNAMPENHAAANNILAENSIGLIVVKVNGPEDISITFGNDETESDESLAEVVQTLTDCPGE